MKIVLDTNVLMSGIFFSGPPHEILKLWWDGQIELLISDVIFKEYQRVGLVLAKKYPGIDISSFLNLIQRRAILIDTLVEICNICADSDDDKFLECAVNAKCNMIVSGDKHLLAVSGFQGIRVLRPKEFTTLFREDYR
ncbi:MAG: putative toxin-antitoxin system toxin component, PIN family [Candidatus Marinimicrobia bacterium]|nr:putative toxin-antitoxin system toxin component, PIN family [Candidatus Neomarinimicrobiota bacterium]